MKNKSIERVFSSLDDFSKVPPPELWANIEAQLEQPKKKKRTVLWWYLAASIVLGLGIPASLRDNSTEKNELSNRNTPVINYVQSQQVVTSPVVTIASKTEVSIAKSKSNFTNNSTAYSNYSSTHQNKKEDNTNIIRNSISKLVLETKTDNSLLISDKKDTQQIKPSNHLSSSSAVASEDSINTIAAELKELENILVNAKKKEVEETKIKEKWSLQVFAGVANSQNHKNEKALGNTIESQQSSAYGVKTNYKLNEKWAVTTGLKINELGQQISEVSYIQTNSVAVSDPPLVGNNPGQFPIPELSYLPAEGINYENSAPELLVQDSQMLNDNPNVTTSSSTKVETGEVAQKLKYIEIPLEISYSILNKKKANIRLNTGGVLGRLISNKVLLDGNTIGSNNKANDYVYGVLFSSTLQYKVYKQTYFFAEPGMNYYLNPTENKAFNQFQAMLNFGINVLF